MADASAIIEYLFGTAPSEAMRPILRDPDADLHVPALCDVEVASALRRVLTARRASAARVTAALTDYLDLPLARHGHAALLPRVLELGGNFSAYDATYIALTEMLDGELLTADAGLSRAARRHTSITTLP